MKPLNVTTEQYDLTEIDWRIVLFTNMRLDRNTVPERLYCYDVRDSDNLDGSVAEIKSHVMVNRRGTILSHEPFPLNKWDSYYPEEWENLSDALFIE